MTQLIKKGNEVIEAQTEDLSYYYSIGYVDATEEDVKVKEAPAKKGTKREE